METRRKGQGSQREPVAGALYGLAYFRVSTIEQANTSFDEDGFSIQAQRDYCQRKAAELGVQLVDEFVDRGKSARTADRPALQAMLTRINEDSDIQYVFVHKLDRLARNREDDVQIGLLLAKNGVRLVSCTENIDDSPSGKLVHGIMADIAEWYSANLSEEAKKGMRKKAENGGTPGNVPIGYQNERHKIVELGKDIGVVRRDEARASIITACFERYSTGLCTLSDVAAYATAQGLRLRATKRLPERPITRTHMQRILHNRYYVGWVTFAGAEYQGEHPPLIDVATFDRVQALLAARNVNKDKSKQRPHHLKGALFCARCGHRLGITVPTKRNGTAYAYFYCLGRQTYKNGCPQGYIPVGDIEDAIHDYWAYIRLPAQRMDAMRRAILADVSGQQEQGRAEIANQRRRITELRQRHQKAKAAYYAGALDLKEFKAEQETIKHGIQVAEDSIARWSIELDSIAQALDTAFALTENPQTLYDTMSTGLKLLLVQAVFEKIWVVDSAVVGCELTEPIAELLTLDARLALAEQHRPASASSGQDDTYFRQRTTMPTLLRSLAEAWERPWVERPRGPLPIDKQKPCPQRGKGSDVTHLVGVMRLNLNPRLTKYLRNHPNYQLEPVRVLPANRHRRWRLRDRMSSTDIAKLIMEFQSGAPKHVLADRYRISLGSVKNLLRAQSVKRITDGSSHSN